MSVSFIRLGGAISYGQGRDWAYTERTHRWSPEPKTEKGCMYIPREV